MCSNMNFFNRQNINVNLRSSGRVAKVPYFGGETRGLIPATTWLKISSQLPAFCLTGHKVIFLYEFAFGAPLNIFFSVLVFSVENAPRAQLSWKISYRRRRKLTFSPTSHGLHKCKKKSLSQLSAERVHLHLTRATFFSEKKAFKS